MNRRNNLKFHIKNQEYFVQLATILNLHADALVCHCSKKSSVNTTAKSLKRIVEDLMWLHKNYKIASGDK